MKKEDLIYQLAEAIKQYEGWKNGIFPSRSFRNNNPGNLKFIGQKEASGADKDGFVIFPSYEAGFRTLSRDIESKLSWTQNLYGFFNTYAPRADKNNPTAYAEFVAKKLGLKANTPFKLALLEQYRIALLFIKPNQPLPEFIDWIRKIFELVSLNTSIQLDIPLSVETCIPVTFYDHFQFLKQNEFKNFHLVIACSYPENWEVKRLHPSGSFYQNWTDELPYFTEIIFSKDDQKNKEQEIKRIILHEFAHAILYWLDYEPEVWRDEIDTASIEIRNTFYLPIFQKYLKI